VDLRTNTGGSQRAVRVAALYLVALAAMLIVFVLYDRTAPGGNASPVSNGLWLLGALFAGFAVFGAVFTLHPAPRAIEVTTDHVVVVGRWGRRRVLPPLDSLSTRVARRYSAGWLADTPVEQVELWGKGVALRTYLVDAELFRGTSPSGPKA